jgi:hypothetical protein
VLAASAPGLTHWFTDIYWAAFIGQGLAVADSSPQDSRGCSLGLEITDRCEFQLCELLDGDEWSLQCRGEGCWDSNLCTSSGWPTTCHHAVYLQFRLLLLLIHRYRTQYPCLSP